ncbi:MAG: PGF-pre-PGF domain-containing protein [Candidatus Aenigmatarchaeota archaeon]
MKAAILLIVFLVALSFPAFATGSISISSVSMPSSVTTGDTFTITMSVTGTEVSDVSGSLTLPTGLGCTPSGSQSISMSGGSGSTSWSCTASVSGDYTNQITASVGALDSGTGQPLSDSLQTGLQVMTPASLTSSSSIASSSIVAGSLTTFTVGVNNAGGTSTTYSISMSCTGLSCSPSSVSSTSIDGNTIVYHTFTVTSTSAGAFTSTATISGNGQTLTTSKSLTVSSSGSQLPAGGGGGGGGGAASRTFTLRYKKGNCNITAPSMVANSIMNFTIAKTDDIAFRQINVSVARTVNNTKIIINRIMSLPESVGHDIQGKVYNYISIEKENITDGDFSKVYIEFALNRTWFDENGIEIQNISLYRWEGEGWNELPTTYISEDDSEVLYQAESPGFSTFVIGSGGAGTINESQAACAEVWSCADWSECENDLQTRTCTDANACGTTADKSAENQPCETISAVATDFPVFEVSIVAVLIVLLLIFVLLEVTGHINLNILKQLFKKKKKEEAKPNENMYYIERELEEQ